MRACLLAIRCAAFCVVVLACQYASAAGTPATPSGPQASPPIFDGETFNGWTTTGGKPVTKGWEIVDGTIHLDISGERGGNIVTAGEYANFDFRFEWKISPRGNSGIKYRVRKYDKGTLGCEYQILDDVGTSEGKKPKSSTAALYALYPPSGNKHLKPVGEFNSSRIVIRGNSVQHWLNGHLVVSVCIGSCEWFQRKAQSKFNNVDGFSENRYGKIMLTDHHSEVWYRNLVLYELPEVVRRVRLVDRLPRVRSLFSGRRCRLSRRCR